MASSKFEVEAAVRQDIGKGASRRLRRQEKIPGVLYGGGKDTLSLTIEHNKIAKALENEAFYSRILTLKLNTQETERVVLKDVQRHAFKPRILHVDFQRIRSDEKLHIHIPLHFTGDAECPGVKEGNGVVSHIISDVEVSCFPDDLPEFITVDLSQMELNQTLHLSDLKLPKGVELVSLAHDNDQAVASVHTPRAEVEEEPITEENVAPSEVPAISQKAEDAGNEGSGKPKGK